MYWLLFLYEEPNFSEIFYKKISFNQREHKILHFIHVFKVNIFATVQHRWTCVSCLSVLVTPIFGQAKCPTCNKLFCVESLCLF